MGATRSNRRMQRSGNRSRGGDTALEKTTAAAKKVQANVAKVAGELTETIRTLLAAKAGSSKENKARRAVRAVVKAVVAAKKKLRKAQRRREKVAARLKVQGKGTATAATKAKPAPAASRARRPKPKPRPRRSKRSSVGARQAAGSRVEAPALVSAKTTMVPGTIQADSKRANQVGVAETTTSVPVR